MGQLYDADILEWSEHQARLLRRQLEGKPGEPPDWLNIIEEIESAGRSQLSAVKSSLIPRVSRMRTRAENITGPSMPVRSGVCPVKSSKSPSPSRSQS